MKNINQRLKILLPRGSSLYTIAVLLAFLNFNFPAPLQASDEVEAIDCKPILTPVHPLLKDLNDGDELYVECGEGTAFITTDVMATAGCPECPISGEVKMGDLRFPADCPTSGYIEKMECWWTVKDDCGNESTWSIYIITIDTKPPVFTHVPADKMIDCNESPFFGSVTAEDACSENVTITKWDTTTGDDCEKKYIRTWKATDDCGNTATASQTITAKDNTPPVFTHVPADKTVECGQVPQMGMATAEDDCNYVDVKHEDSGDYDACNGGTITRTFTARDACGNKATAKQTITVKADNTPPVFTYVPADKTVECGHVPQMGMATAEDDCSSVSITFHDSDDIDVCNGGIITRTFTAKDACGNKATAKQTITVKADKTPPVFTYVPHDKTVDCGTDISMGMATAEDNCSSVTVTFMDSDGGDVCNGSTITRTYTATDACGNKATAKQTITIKADKTPPVFTYVPADKTINCGSDMNMGMATAEDACSSVTVTFEDMGGADVCNGGTKTRIFTATDACGNKATAKQTITMNADKTPPVFTHVPADKTVACGNDMDMGMATAEDACSSVTVTFEDSGDADACSGGTKIRTYTATDACGNKATAKQTITILPDNTPPYFTFVPDDKNAACGGDNTMGMATAEDACSGVTVTFKDSGDPGQCGDGAVVRTFTATDDCGNTATAQQVLNISDSTPPIFTFVPSSQVVDCGQDLPDFGTPTAEDDCGDVMISF